MIEKNHIAFKEETFWDKVDIKGSNKCWNWKGNKNSRGYGHFLFGGMSGAHRMAYLLFYGYIDDKLWVLHSCDNRLCCNPNHLRQGTHIDNINDMIDRKRHYNNSKTHCPQGHEYTQDNIYWENNGKYRVCKKCKIEASKQRRIKRLAYLKEKYKKEVIL